MHRTLSCVLNRGIIIANGDRNIAPLLVNWNNIFFDQILKSNFWYYRSLIYLNLVNIKMAETGAASAHHDDDDDFQTGDAGASST